MLHALWRDYPKIVKLYDRRPRLECAGPKPDIADDRESASIEVLRELERRGAEIAVLDPVVGNTRIAEHGFEPVAASDDLTGYAIAVVLTDHEVLDLKKIAAEAPMVLDTRGAYRRAGLQLDNVETL